MDNPRFFYDENTPLVHEEDIDYDYYNTPNTSRVDETMPGFMGKERTLQLRHKSKTR